MPIYVYLAEDPQGSSCALCSERFERMEKLADPPATHCEQCNSPIRRVITPPAVHAGSAHLMKEKTIADKGFTQYRKVGKGVYEKTAGKGPNFIADDGK